MNSAQFLVLTLAAGTGICAFVMPRLRLGRRASSLSALLRSRFRRRRAGSEEIVAERVEPFAEMPGTTRFDGPIIDEPPPPRKRSSVPDDVPGRKFSDAFRPPDDAEKAAAEQRNATRRIPSGNGRWWREARG